MLESTNISALQAAHIPSFRNNDVLISINDPHEPLHELRLNRDHPRILTVTFADILTKLSWNGKEYTTIDDKTTKELIDFIDFYKDYNFIVHCTAGVSRSAAVCLYIHQIYGHQLKENFWLTSLPNCFVLGKLISERIKLKG